MKHGKIHCKIDSMLNYRIGVALALQVGYLSFDTKLKDQLLKGFELPKDRDKLRQLS